MLICNPHFTAKLNKEPPYSTGTQLTPQYYLAEMASPAEIEVLVAQQDFEAALAEVCQTFRERSILSRGRADHAMPSYSSYQVCLKLRCSITSWFSNGSRQRL